MATFQDYLTDSVFVRAKVALDQLKKDTDKALDSGADIRGMIGEGFVDIGMFRDGRAIRYYRFIDKQGNRGAVDYLAALIENGEIRPLSKKVKQNISRVRPLHEIAREIRRDWKKPYFGAVPYLDAMSSLDSIKDMYMYDTADSIVRYFLANASTWRGEKAREIKKELKSMLAGGARKNPPARIGKVEKISFTHGSMGQQYVTIDGVKYWTWFDTNDFPGIGVGAVVEYVPDYRNVDYYGDQWTAKIVDVIEPKG